MFVVYHLGFNLTEPAKIHEGNAATVAVSSNKIATKRLNHIDFRHFAILDWVKNGDIIF